MVDWSEITKGGISAVWGLMGVIVGSWLTARNQRIERRNSRSREQLMEFYAPLRGMRADIKAKSDMRAKVHEVAGDEWPQKFAGVDDPQVKRQIDEEAWAGYEKVVKYSDDQLKNDIIPTYQKMAAHFVSHMGYAEESTISHYPAFVEFVEIWNRFLQGSLPREVANRLSQSESKLYPFYDDIEMNAKRLSNQLKGDAWFWGRFVALRSRRKVLSSGTK